MSKYAKRTDANHVLITKIFRDLGCSVFSAHTIGMGFPDLVVGKDGKTILVEIKKDAKAPFTEAQEMFMKGWKGSAICRIHDVEGAITLIRTLSK